MTDPNRPLLGEPNAPCRACGAPLAADQRYCLQCGARRAEARLPFLEILARQVPAAPASETVVTRTATGGNWFSRLSTNTAAVAGVACLLLALGVGVLIGGLGSDDASGSSGAPQIITVGGGAVAPAAATSAAPATTSAPAGTEDGTTDDGGDASSSDGKSSKKSASSAKTDKKAAAEVKDLEKSSGDDYAKKSEKLPKTLGTGGAPPPKDTSGKPIGGGSETEEIG